MSRIRSLSSRLTRMNLLVSGSVLLIAALAFFTYDLLSFRINLIHALDAEAQIVGDNSISALTFNDPGSAAATLATLAHSPHVLSATLVDTDGMVFARYGEAGVAGPELRSMPPGEDSHAWPSWGRVLVGHRIVFQGKTVGTVYVSASLSEMRSRALQYGLIACVILLFCMAAALLISATARRLIAEPITELADTALAVSRDQDFTVRAAIRADFSEIAVLVSAFNRMLQQVGERDAALLLARDQLEARVQERTSDLEERTSELLAANRELEAFSYTVAHDLRGPLDGISGILFLLQQDDASQLPMTAMLDQLQGLTTNMSTLIDDLLNFARATTTPIKLDAVDLSKLARDIAAELSLADPERDVTFQIADTPFAQADPGLMRIVLDNLLRNAWKYTSRHPKACIEFGAKVSTHQQPMHTTYFVRDDGAGFDASMANQLFQPFQRLHTKSQFPGTGIGLATVQRIIARQDGSIWAEGATEKGAAFFFTLGSQTEAPPVEAPPEG